MDKFYETANEQHELMPLLYYSTQNSVIYRDVDCTEILDDDDIEFLFRFAIRGGRLYSATLAKNFKMTPAKMISLFKPDANQPKRAIAITLTTKSDGSYSWDTGYIVCEKIVYSSTNVVTVSYVKYYFRPQETTTT